MSRVLIIDDEEAICWGLRRVLEKEGLAVDTAASAEQGFKLAKTVRPDVIILDVRLPGMDGLSASELFRQKLEGQRANGQRLDEVPIIIMTAFGDLPTAVSAFSKGVFEYLTKPFDLQQMVSVVHRALRRPSKASNAPLTALNAAGEAEELLGQSPAMQEVFKRIALVAPTDASVLITGESGTGKELVARAIHRHSLLAKEPFLPVNLAALSGTLIESELFGHTRGAFTGAEAARQGVLELAHNGTVLFDEAADIPPHVQVKLLRVLEQHEVTPVGDARARPARFRVLTATNRDLRKECAAGNFREDLYYRMAVFEIALPALRERPDDIPLLAERFAQRVQQRSKQAVRILPETIAELQRRAWPGNVRELRNAIEHGALLARGSAIAPEQLPAPTIRMETGSTSWSAQFDQGVRSWATEQLASGQTQHIYERFLELVEPPLLQAVLDHEHGNKAAAAELLGMHRATLRKKLQTPDTGD
jgi:two-component system nitrogen regulation response regulator GlnG